jgi:hypothetical protein
MLSRQIVCCSPALQQRRVATNFRDNALLNVFKVALVALQYLLDNRADDKLKEQVRSMGFVPARYVRVFLNACTRRNFQ